MSIPLQTELLRADLVRIMHDIFATMLCMEIAESPQHADPSPTAVVTASMHLGGAWNGAVLLQCQLQTACEYAAVMLGVDRPTNADDDVKDVMGELINMVAGNFKAVLGGGCYLSLPTVVEGSDYRFHILRGAQTERLGFETPAGPVYVSLVEIQQPEPKPG